MHSSNKFSSRYDFGVLANRYDRWYKTREGGIYDLFEKQAILSLVGSEPSKGNLLEVGCGTGWWSCFFSQLGYTVTGVDLSPEMVAIAQSKHIPAASFQVTDAHDLPFVDNSFAASAAIAAIEFMKDAETVVKEMVRCTQRPGGTIYLGLLNASSKINRQRAEKKGSLYEKARFFNLEEITRLLSPLGKVHLAVCAFPFAVMLGKGGLWIDRIGTHLKFKNGAFIAVRIDL